MGRYYNPPSEVPVIGRKLETDGPFDVLAVQLQPGELLFAVAEDGLQPETGMTALYMESEQDYIASRQGEMHGYYEVTGYFGVLKKAAEQKMGPLPNMGAIFPCLDAQDFGKVKGALPTIERIGEVELHGTEVTFAEYSRTKQLLKDAGQAKDGHFVVIEEYEENYEKQIMRFKAGMYKRT